MNELNLTYNAIPHCVGESPTEGAVRSCKIFKPTQHHKGTVDYQDGSALFFLSNHKHTTTMSNFKNELTNYQSIPRELIFDNTLSDRARFLFCYMASKPDNWDFYLVPMAKELGYSVGTLRKYISELVESGWIKKGKQENIDGKYSAVKYTLVWNKKKKRFTKELYANYLQTEYWKKVRENKIKQSGHKCQLCGSKNNLNVHHNSYEHIGNELNHLNDLVVLCKDCHEKFHDII